MIIADTFQPFYSFHFKITEEFKGFKRKQKINYLIILISYL